MAEMLIDGAKLDACLDAEADAIRVKTGGTDPIPYDYENNRGFADAIAAIPSGGGITPTGTKQISITQNGTTTEDVTQYANAEITVNVPSGASLPSVISKIDGGSFTFATDTAVQSNKISHTLGVKPKGYIIWSDDVMRVADNYQNICLMFSYGIGLPWLGSIGGTENQIGYSYAMWRKTNGAVQEQNSGAPKINDTEIAPVGFYYWCGGATYKWLAWA